MTQKEIEIQEELRQTIVDLRQEIIGYEVKNSKLAAENRRLTRENKELATRLMETQAQALYQRRFVESLIEEVTHEDTVG